MAVRASMRILIWANVVFNLTSFACAQTSYFYPLGNFCRRWYHQSQLKNGNLYIYAGLETFRNTTREGYQETLNYTITPGPNLYMIGVNMSESWDWQKNISETQINRTVNPQTGTYPPLVERGVLFQGPANDTNIYLYAGRDPSINTAFPGATDPYTNQYTLWGFDTNSHQWSQWSVFSSVPERPSWGAYTEAPDLGLAFYFNGMLTNYSSSSTYYLGNDTLYLEGMVMLDLNSQTATNISTASISNSRGIAGGSMTYVSVLGDKGVLVQIGGMSGPASTFDTSDVGTLAAMNQVIVYDVAAANSSDPNSGWYTQTTSGTSPQPRIDFCLVLATAPDNSSQNIFLYGGWDPTTQTPYDEIWVLSLPSFTWISIYNGTSPRFGHTCHATGNRQFITVGGLDSANDTDSCDWEYKSIAVYDMTDENPGWGSAYTADKGPFEVPSVIYNVVGGVAGGNATALSPTNGWSSMGLAKVMTGTTNQTAPANITTPSSTTSKRKKSSHLSGGAIAGIVVGCVVGAALIVAIVAWLFISRRRRRRQDERPVEPAAEMDENQVSEMPPSERPVELGSSTEPVELPAPEGPLDHKKSDELNPPPIQEHPAISVSQHP